MAGVSDIFGAHEGIPGQERLSNSPRQLNYMANFFNTVLLFLLPAIIGVGFFRDFRSRMHHLLYAYPFKKSAYLPAKFLSGFLITALVSICLGLGMMLGAHNPWVDPALVGPFDGAAYFQVYALYILPNLLFFGVLVFVVVGWTRNIYAGFIAVILVLVFQAILGAMLSSVEAFYWAALLDPLGTKARDYMTRYWTQEELNLQYLPLEGVLVYNRLIWLGISATLWTVYYQRFRFQQHGAVWRRKGQRTNSSPLANPDPGVQKPLPKASLSYAFKDQLQAASWMGKEEARQILTSGFFICMLLGGLLMVFFQQSVMNPQYGFEILPTTWKMLQTPMSVYAGVINFLTFLTAGILIHRARMNRMQMLMDSTATPDWVLLLSRFWALLLIQLCLLSIIIIAGVSVQLFHGYTDIQLGHYFFEVFGLHLINFVIWGMLALFVHFLFKHLYLAFFVLLLIPMAMLSLPQIGIEQEVFRFNQAPGQIIGFDYSDMDGYGTYLPTYFGYKIYWLMAGFLLLLGAYFWATRGLTFSWQERWEQGKARWKGTPRRAFLAILILFLSMGTGIYLEENVLFGRLTQENIDALLAENEKQYKHFEGMNQPRIRSLYLEMDLFPETYQYQSKGTYQLVNLSDQPIDSLLINYHLMELTEYSLSVPHQLLQQDSFLHYDLYLLEPALQAGDSLALSFEVKNPPNTFFRKSPRIAGNGTFIRERLYPAVGYRPVELANTAKRRKYGLAPKSHLKAQPEDTTALGYSLAANDVDWVNLEIILSTSGDQLPIAPGYVVRDWEVAGRRYIHYKMDSPMKHYYGVNSGRFAVKEERWQGLDLSVYYHPEHPYTVDDMMDGLKASIGYCQEAYGPYQHQQARVIEFPLTLGRFATVFANSIPFTEAHFVADVNREDPGAINLPFYVTAHEIAHQWWGHQFISADVAGAKMLTESLAEYSALKVLEKRYGVESMRSFLKFDLDLYLKGRGQERREEMPLMYSLPTQNYINYRKGSLIMYALSDYLGEKRFNQLLRSFLDRYRWQEPPLPTSLDLITHLREATPDSLQYLYRDMFETITLYDNRILETMVTPLENGQYQLDLHFQVRKYRTDGKGRMNYTDSGLEALTFPHPQTGEDLLSLPLADYLDIGVFPVEKGKGESINPIPIYLKKHRISEIDNHLSLILDQKPGKVGIDPYLKLIDRISEDNHQEVE